jgi:hypothetical protein
MITAAVWIGAFAAFSMFMLDTRWTGGERLFLFALYWCAPIMATWGINS